MIKLLKRVAKWLPVPAQAKLRSMQIARQAQSKPHVFQFEPPTKAAPSPYAFPVDKDNVLEDISDEWLPTKRLHHYMPHYWAHFRDVRLKVKRVLEIGVQTEKSIRTWEKFFPEAEIYGIDILPECRRFESGRVKIRVGDQSDAAFLRSVVVEAGGSFDIVIDDGSHWVEHQIKSFEVLFPLLSEHGIYVMEDTGGSVGDYGQKVIRSLSALAEDINYWPPQFDATRHQEIGSFPEEAGWLAKNVIGIAFYRYIVFVMRGRNPEDNPHLANVDRS